MPELISKIPTKDRYFQIKRALSLIWQSGPVWAVARILLLMVQGLLPLLLIYLMKLVLDGVADGLSANEKSVAFQQVLFLIGIAGGITLLIAILRSVAALVNETQSQMVTDHLFDILHAKSLAVDLEYYENAKYYDTLHRAQQEAPYRPTRILNNLVQVGQNGISLIAIAGLLISFNWIIVVVLAVAAIPNVVVRLKYSNKLYNWQRQRTSTDRRAWYFNFLLTRDTHAKELRLFNLGAVFRHRFRDIRKLLLREKISIAIRRSAANSLTQLIGALIVFGTVGYIAYRTLQGNFTIGDLGMFFMAFQRGNQSVQQLLNAIAGLYEDNLFLTNLYEFLNIRPTIKDPIHPQSVPHPMQNGIIFQNVSFAYPPGDRMVLKDISLSIRPGEHIGIVGENGSGKTTLVKLLCRLYDPTSGQITWDGKDLRQFRTEALRREISVIFQDYAKYHLTARENIWFGNIDFDANDERVMGAARHTGAEEIINKLPDRYETILGKWFEKGEELSIGEWQKIALARAFLRDSQIIILDEPTSALDARSEYELFKKSHEIASGKSAILISHRISTVRMADRIYVTDQGGIIEAGTHNELIRRNGKYANLFDLQAQHYR
jgi:ATP-binding cassette, subfamily B, bacterial